MKMKTVLSFLAGAVLAVALMFPLVGQTKERHPEIEGALSHLNQAKTNLEKAQQDFGGHRAKALELTNQAISECNQALSYDQK